MSEYRLKVSDYDEYLILDPRDWDEAKHQKWVFNGTNIVNGAGVPILDYLGKGGLYNMWGKIHDVRMKFLIPLHLEYVVSEELGHYVLREKKNG